MKKLILLVVLLFLSTSLSAIENLKSLKQLQEHDLIFLIYEKNGCPWCSQYKSVLESSIIIKYKSEIKFFKVKKGSEIFSELRKKFRKKPIIYPMTYILKLDKNKESEIIYEIYGYQTQEYIEEVFKDELLIK